MKKILFTAFALFFISIVSFAQFRIDTPDLLGPDNEDTDQMPDVILNWTAVLNATGYNVVLGTTENLNNPIVDTETTYSAFQNTYLMFNQTYYWKVRAVEGEDFSPWSETRSFSTLPMIEITDPDDGDDGLQAQIDFEWEDKYNSNDLSGFDFYQLQLDLDPDVFDNASETPEWDLLIPEGNGNEHTVNYVYYGDTMYWRMRIMHPVDTCPWTEVWSFITDPQVELDKPNNGTSNSDLSFFIEWDEYDGTLEYDYQIHNNPTFNGTLTYFVDSTEVPTPQLRYGTEYYWRVRAKNVRDTTIWSEVWSFATASAPILTNPSNMADSVILKPQLAWEPILGSNTYDLQYDTDSTFAESLKINLNSTFFNVGTTLEENTKYFWRVRACAKNDTSDYSEPWSFTTLGAIGIDEYFNSNELSIFPNPASDYATLLINARKAGEVKFSLTDLTGKELQTGLIEVVPGENTKELELKNFAKGIYLINLSVNDGMITRKLIIK